MGVVGIGKFFFESIFIIFGLKRGEDFSRISIPAGFHRFIYMYSRILLEDIEVQKNKLLLWLVS
jgi:hypothetical protein